MEYANAGSRLLLINPDVELDREVANEGYGHGSTTSPSTSLGYGYGSTTSPSTSLGYG